MAVGIELARAMGPLTFFQIKVFYAQLAIRYRSTTQLNTRAYCEKTRYIKRVPVLHQYRYHTGTGVIQVLAFVEYGRVPCPGIMYNNRSV